MAGLGDHRAARGRLRASRADRERVIEELKAAFVQERLTKDEFDGRVGQALASRTYADLALLTADLPAGLATDQPPHTPARTPQRPGAKGIRSSVRVMSVGTILTSGLWVAALLAGGPGALMVALTFTIVYLGTLLLAGAVLLESRHEQRSASQPPPRSGSQPPRSGPGGGTSRRRSASASQLPQIEQIDKFPWIDPGQRHIAEAAGRLFPRPQLPAVRLAAPSGYVRLAAPSGYVRLAAPSG